MIMLISGIIAIALFASIMVAGSGTFSTEAIIRREAAHVMQSSVANIGNAFQAYRIANSGARPSSVNWKTELADYAPSRSADQMARPTHGLQWSYGIGSNRSWFCLSGDFAERSVIQAMASVAKETAIGKVTVAMACPTSGGVRSIGETPCRDATSDICAGNPVDGSSARALILYPQG